MSVRGTVYLYWKTNPEWYDYDENEKEYLTNKAPEEAKESFKKYLALRQKEKETGIKIFWLYNKCWGKQIESKKLFKIFSKK